MTLDPHSLRRVALAEDEGQRLDVVVGRRFPSISRRVAKRLALEGKVELDGDRVPPSTRVREGQLLAICVTTPTREVAGARILERTEGFIYAYKPPGVHTHRLRPDEPAALSDFVTAAHPECRDASEDPREGGAVHRLDRDTSGVVAFARHPTAWVAAREAFGAGAVTKIYLARCAWRSPVTPSWPPRLPAGAFEAWIRSLEEAPEDASEDAPSPGWWIRAPLGTSEDRRTVEVRLDGHRASSRLHLLHEIEGLRLLQVQIDTGLRHQIRAHLAWIDHPIEGDRRYGGVDAPRLGLHAWCLHLAGIPGEPPVSAAPDEEFLPEGLVLSRAMVSHL